ncbi:MAG TPA: amidase family protein [Gammaproteobacteria bacterium]|nr:amidase family protein [Gammaproteobacteria bacterium]
MPIHRKSIVLTVSACVLSAAALWGTAASAQQPFALEEASIAGIHAAIRSGKTTCAQVVQGYMDRARAYNGVCTALVTEDGKPVAAATGAVRAGAALQFPTKTVKITDLFPDYANYTGDKPDFGRVEATASDPTVMQQYGMVSGIPNAGQVNALESINIRGERSVTCKGAFDAPPGTPLPAGAPAECDKFRQQPDALETAKALDAKYGRSPDLKAMPLYCVAMSFKAVYDAKDIRSTGGGDVSYATDFAPQDSTLVARLRDSGAIIYAHAHNAEYNGGSGDPKGMAAVTHPMLGTGGARETWGGTTCNPYDTSRETGGSSGGSGASVAANLVVCSICESTGGSCRSPGTHNGVVTFVPTKGMISYGGGIGADPYRDRPGISCRSVSDAATVLDAFRDKKTGKYFDARDIYTALPRSFASKTPYVAALADPKTAKPLAGMKIGVLRELMVKSSPANEAIIDTIDKELKVLQSLGAELVESTGPGYTDDPAIPNMPYTFENAIAEVVPYHLPEILSWQKDGKPEFSVPGFDVTSRDYLVAAASLKAPWPANLDFNRIMGNAPETEDAVSAYTFSFQFAQYLLNRGDKRVHDWATLNANAKYYSNARDVAMDNWEHKAIDIRTDEVSFVMRRKDAMRMAIVKVLEQNAIDVFVNPPLIALPNRIGAPNMRNAGGAGHGYGARLGLPEVFVPAGFADTVYEPVAKLSADGKEYSATPGTTPIKLASPLPFNIAFWAGPGDESIVLKVASAYEAATHHRKAPPGFGPVPDTRLSAR